MQNNKKEKIHELVRKYYSRTSKNSCFCNDETEISVLNIFERFGYSAKDVIEFYKNSNIGLCCGNPLPIAEIKAGETVLDLGSGEGFDCYLAAKLVGERGKVIGVDMTPEMVNKARKNIEKWDYKNVEFRLGEIENLPVDDDSVDVIISNCVINLSPDKSKVFKEAFRVLKPGGRLAISDIIAIAPLPEELRNDPELYCLCIAGTVLIDELKDMLKKAGFQNIHITPIYESQEIIRKWAPMKDIEDYVVSATIKAIKPCKI
jgi:SAM-dependent methyltransferase